MSFQILVNGEVEWETDLQVDRVSVQTSRGEAAAVGIAPGEGAINILVTEVAPGGPVRLEHVENAQRRANRERVTEGVAVGNTFADRATVPEETLRSQGNPEYTVNPSEAPSGGDFTFTPLNEREEENTEEENADTTGTEEENTEASEFALSGDAGTTTTSGTRTNE